MNIKRDLKGRFVKGVKIPKEWYKHPKGFTNSGSFTSERMKGKNNLFYGRRHTKESKKKISKNSAMKNNPEVREKVSKALKGSKHTKKKKKKQRKAMKRRVRLGIHNFWKGGISKYYQQLNHSLRNSEWKHWREAVFKRDNYTCQKCGLRSGNGKAVYLEPHHIVSVKDCVDMNFMELIYDIENGLTLCKECHKLS